MENRLHHLRNDRLSTTVKEMNEEAKLVRMSRLIFGRRKNITNNNNSNNNNNQQTFTLKGKKDQLLMIIIMMSVVGQSIKNVCINRAHVKHWVASRQVIRLV